MSQRMNANSEAAEPLKRLLRELAARLSAEAGSLQTDIFFQIMPGSGDVIAGDDDDREFGRCTVGAWAGLSAEEFRSRVAAALGGAICELRGEMEALPLQKPYSFVLTDEAKETFDELYLVDDDTLLVSGELMEGLSDDLDRFWEELSKDM